MVDSRPDPNWDLLPADPAAFFDLSPGFGRTELRRAYTRLIRRFKPERHPEEFQRIRDAFEALDVRPGRFPLAADFVVETEREVESGPANVPESEWSWTEDPVEAPEPRPIMAELARRLAASSPDALHRELTRQDVKAPAEHYALAVLTDAVEPECPAGFAARLVDGLVHHPAAPGLWEVLFNYFWQPLDASEGAAALQAAVALEPDGFLALTEPLWIRLGKVMPFPDWRSLLDVARPVLERAPIGSRALFELQLTRAMVLRADADWVEARMSWLAAHETEIPSSHDDSLDQLELLAGYRRSRDALLAGHPLRRRVDRVLRAWVEEDAAEVQRRFLDLQQEILAEPERVLEAFPSREPELEAMVSLYLILAAELAPQLGISAELLFEDEIDSDQVEEPLRFLDKLDKRTVRSPLGRRWNRRLTLQVVGSGLGCLSTVGLVVFGTVQICRWIAVGPDLAMGVMIGVICAVVILGWAIHKWAVRSRRRLSEDMRWRAHAGLWRAAVVDFQFEANLTHWQLIHATHYGHEKRWPFVIHLRDTLENDPGLVFFGVALKLQG